MTKSDFSFILFHASDPKHLSDEQLTEAGHNPYRFAADRETPWNERADYYEVVAAFIVTAKDAETAMERIFFSTQHAMGFDWTQQAFDDTDWIDMLMYTGSARSTSTGDVLVHFASNTAYLVDRVGFTEIDPF